jgi:hypothetical protein
MGKKVSMTDAIQRLHDKGWKTKLDSRYLTAHQDDGSAYQLVPVSGDQIELNELRSVPEYKPNPEILRDQKKRA